MEAAPRRRRGAARPGQAVRSGADSSQSRRVPPAEIRGRLAAWLGAEPPVSVFSGIGVVDDADSAARLLRNLLRSRLLPLDAQVAGERLAKALGVHRNTMSKVLRTLADEGYLHRRRGRPARVAAHEKVLPERHTNRISHTALAREQQLDIRTVAVRHRQCRVRDLDPARQARVASSLVLEPGSRVIVYSRIRELRAEGASWVPAIAETAYFAAARAPEFFYEGLAAPGRVSSIHEYLAENGIEPVNSEYRVRIAPLPEPFWGDWAKSAGLRKEKIAALRFLRFESTTHCHKGAIEYSIAYLAEGLFALSTTDLALATEKDALRASSGRLTLLGGGRA